MDSNLPAGARVLVVGSDPELRETVAGILEDCGCRVAREGEGKAALDKFGGADFDLVIVELGMSGMPGLEVCRRMKQLPGAERVPIICVTEPDDDATLRAVFAAGARDFLFRPIRPAELEARARVALQKGRETGETDESDRSGTILAEAGAVCHELNQPLQFILGMVQLALMDVAEDQPLYGQLKTIQEKIEKMGSITGRLIEVIKSGIASGSRGKTMPGTGNEKAPGSR